MASKIKFDVVDNYDPSESEEEYTENEKQLLKDVRKKPKDGSDSEDEFLAFDDEEDYDDGDKENSDFDDILDIEKYEHDSDINEEEDDELPDSRAWGKQKKSYYNTDFIDQDYSTFTAQEEELAKQEEEEARNIQQRLAKELDEGDFTLDVFCESTPDTAADVTTSTKKSTETKVKTDFSNLTKRQRLDLFKKDAPEFDGLVADYDKYSTENIKFLQPVIEYFTSKEFKNSAILDFIKTKNELTINYCTNIIFYLLLKSKRIPIRNHPVVKRMLQVRQLLIQLEKKYEDIVKPEIVKLLADIENGKEIEFAEDELITKKPTKKLGILKMFAHTPAVIPEEEDVDDEEDDQEEDEEDEESEEDNYDAEPILKKLKLQHSSAEEDDEENEEDMETPAETEPGKRGITYQIKKNKGLTPHKKKELRNARVKNRNKYKKALVRRKGAVRPIRSQDKRYDGEMTGIKANVKRSIKIK